MCCDCWKEYGSPKIYNEKIKKAASLIDGVYIFSTVGGALHVIIDDWNIDDCYVNDSFYDECIKEHENVGLENQVKAERECLDFLRGLTVEERASALALSDECFTVGDTIQ